MQREYLRYFETFFITEASSALERLSTILRIDRRAEADKNRAQKVTYFCQLPRNVQDTMVFRNLVVVLPFTSRTCPLEYAPPLATYGK